MVFCRHCGKNLQVDNVGFCPFCGAAQKNTNSDTKIRQSLNQPKSSGKTLVIALLAGVVFFNGIGHLYIGKIRRGIIILVIGWILGILTILFIPFVIVSIVFNLWQGYNAYKLAEYYNDYLNINGKAPW
jgi:TM2 domain-containing membrane protein YozV